MELDESNAGGGLSDEELAAIDEWGRLAGRAVASVVDYIITSSIRNLNQLEESFAALAKKTAETQEMLDEGR